MNRVLKEKYSRLERILRSLKRVVIAFSGGVDSTFLLKAAKDSLPAGNVLAVIARSETFPKREYDAAVKFASDEKINHIVIRTKELSLKVFSGNPVNRCYYCKKELFSKLTAIQRLLGYYAVCDGSNFDDRLDMRHGRAARDELGVMSPLEKAGLTKDDIRALSKAKGLGTHGKPSFACLASRFPTGDGITKKKLKRVEAAEDFLRDSGFSQVRVRDHGDIARIELYPDEIIRMTVPAEREKINSRIKALGYRYVAVDLEGYRTGRMNNSGKRRTLDGKRSGKVYG